WPIVLQNYFRSQNEQYCFKSRRQRAMLIQNLMRHDSIIASQRLVVEFCNTIGQRQLRICRSKMTDTVEKVVDLADFLPRKQSRVRSTGAQGRVSSNRLAVLTPTQQLDIPFRSVDRAGAVPLFCGFERLLRGETHRERPPVRLAARVGSRDGS